ncbi:AIPR family protein [Azotobacter salinestris]|uniref:AIPR family protein n=1 Tax=Azotobacter salinestris TaxID=69964 RepID=UPI0032DFE24C
MEIDVFRTELLESVRANALAYNDSFHSSFVSNAGERLVEAEELSDFQSCHFEGIGSNGRKLLVDGYAFDEADNSLALVVANFLGDEENSRLDPIDIKRHFGMLKAFIEESAKGVLTSGGKYSIEESEPGFGLASDLKSWMGKVDRFRLYLISDGELSEIMRSRDFPEEEINGVPTEFRIWDIIRFHRAYESATGRDNLVVDLTMGNGAGLQFLRAGGTPDEYDAYLCMIPGETLAKVYDRYGSRMLEGNIRSFLSLKGDVNKQIRNTILNKPTMFFAYNNGISATAEAVEFGMGPNGPTIVSATNLQIVNGGQTTASLALALRKDSADLSAVHVQMKLSVLPPESAAEMIPHIARYANSQNKVNEADFFSNHAYHVRLEEFSRRIWAPAIGGSQHQTHWFYERTRGQYLNEQSKLSRAEKNRFQLQSPRKQLLTKTDIAKLENTWRCMPQVVSLGSQKNFREFAKWISQRWEQNNAVFHEHYFRQLVALAILFRFTERFVTEQPWYQAGGYRANLVTYSLAKLKRIIDTQGDGMVLDLAKVWDSQSVPQELARQIAVISKEVAGVLTSSERLKENVTEWAKMQACWARVEQLDIPLVNELRERLVNPEVEASAQSQAKRQQIQDQGINVQMAVVALGGAKWAKICQWGKSRKLLSPKESSLLSLAASIPNKFPSTDKQYAKIWEIRNRLMKEGCEELL